ncbi:MULTISPECIES: hypothetical protein [unclassified Microbacterium]|uniref:hypothetical protein n=1 Tax=unclassified Microbacterium TaxID=2609290 RepID=UPI0012F8356E|nr:hypothetical protein [Microbacterium sp. MAH-37]MVQ43620.1 hypothetical protein [Microbacterium sp. MAH-37]
MRHDNTTIGPLSGRFTPNWTIADVLDHYAVHDALPAGLEPELLRRIDEALSPGIRWHHQARTEALVRSLVMQVHAEPAKGGIRISRLLDEPRTPRSARSSSRSPRPVPGRIATRA